MLLTTLVDLSRWQFALTAMYHWLFVPLTLGLGFLIAFMETRYVMTGDEFWKRTTKFWMKLFAVNFAMGVATGIILEFEFGTNWSNYSWFVGDIFGAPLAIEGIFAFFMESTFFAVMYFGWNKVSKKASWMQYPIGMEFNPDTARSEMTDFWQVVFSPVAINKFLHSVTNGYVLASIFVIAVSSWFLLRKREQTLARKSIRIASVFGIISLAVLIGTGDGSAYNVAKVQPMKLAAMEGLYDGSEKAPLVAVGILNPDKDIIGEEGADEDPYLFEISFPNMLSFLATRQADGFVPGINDIIKGGYEFTDREGNTYIEPSFAEKKAMGTAAVTALADYQTAKESGDTQAMAQAEAVLEQNFDYFGYHYVEEPEDLVPNVPLVFYAFHIMVALGMFFILLFILYIIFEWKNLIVKDKHKWLLWLGIISVPLVYICSQSGWIVAEVGRQPWTIQNLLPVNAAVSGVESGNVLTTLIIFAVLFTAMLCVEISIMLKQIKKGGE